MQDRVIEPGRAVISLLGPPIEHCDSLRAMLEPRFGRVSWLPDSLRFHESRETSQSRLQRLTDQIRGTRHPEYLGHVLRALDELETRLVIGYWGTMPLPDLVAIKKARPHVSVILLVLCHPLALSTPGIMRQNFFMRRLAKYLDGIIYPPGDMEGYFYDRILGGHAPASVVIPPCWPAAFHARARKPPPQDAPNLVYVGRTDLASRTIHPADDIRPLMAAILDAGIHLHHGHSPETDDRHPRRKLFRPLPLPRLIEKIGGYDASLMAYNTQACARDDRFRLTVPDRLITGTAAGIPIAIPKHGYDASKLYLHDYPAVIEFDSPHDLSAALGDRREIDRLQGIAWEARQCFRAEHHGLLLQRFIERLL